MIASWLRKGIYGQDIMVTLQVYLASIAVLAPVGLVITILFGTDAVFRVTPILAVVLAVVGSATMLLLGKKRQA